MSHGSDLCCCTFQCPTDSVQNPLESGGMALEYVNSSGIALKSVINDLKAVLELLYFTQFNIKDIFIIFTYNLN
jgi:hypothetical protein